MGISSIIFIVLIAAGFGFFGFNVKKVIANINLGRDKKINDRKGERWKVMTLVALGQKKMFHRPIPALLHLVIYLAFILTQVELIEIIIDGITGSHRIFQPYLGGFYKLVISII